jgi:ActR/RegA family two-component response regulator
MIIRRVGRRSAMRSPAASFEDAAKLARDTPFDCITLDLSLGQHSGT